jgi:hypothetical protein
MSSEEILEAYVYSTVKKQQIKHLLENDWASIRVWINNQIIEALYGTLCIDIFEIKLKLPDHVLTMKPYFFTMYMNLFETKLKEEFPDCRFYPFIYSKTTGIVEMVMNSSRCTTDLFKQRNAVIQENIIYTEWINTWMATHLKEIHQNLLDGAKRGESPIAFHVQFEDKHTIAIYDKVSHELTKRFSKHYKDGHMIVKMNKEDVYFNYDLEASPPKTSSLVRQQPL